MARSSRPGEWVFLTYSLPRTPSAPRLSLWRKLKRLGVAQLADGLVALPADARTREQLEWAAEEATEAGGTAGVWLARPTTRAQERELAQTMNAARAEEYRSLVQEAETALGGNEVDRARTLRRLRAENHRIRRRDFFRPVEREQARQALSALAASLSVLAHVADAEVVR
jgi:uncharacterized protein YdbL (DUF1318 family)